MKIFKNFDKQKFAQMRGRLNMKTTAIIVAAGKSTRMGGDKPKQYMDLGGKPILAWTIEAFEKAACVNDIVIVSDDATYVQTEIVEKFGFSKVRKVIAGGPKRHYSVLYGLQSLKIRRPQLNRIASDYVSESTSDRAPESTSDLVLELTSDLAPESTSDLVPESTSHLTPGLEISHAGAKSAAAPDVVLIHDGARPLISGEAIEAVTKAALEYGAAICAVSAKDTIHVADKYGFITQTPPRDTLWQAQTPQAFRFEDILAAYEVALGHRCGALARDISEMNITDDAMVFCAAYPDRPVKLVFAGYDNIKITTPEDLALAKGLILGHL